MTIASKITTAAFALSSASAIGCAALGRSNRFGLLDMSMPALTATLNLTTRPGRTRDAATIALLAGTAGDMSATIPFKLGWFGAGHIAWTVAFAAGHKRRWWIIAPVLIGAGIWASAHAGGLRPACAIYTAAVAVMAVAASGYSTLAGMSAIAFAASDFLIGVGAWRAKTTPAWAEALTIAIYLAAQAGLTAAVVQGEKS